MQHVSTTKRSGKPIGTIESINGSLTLVLLDADAVAEWEPLDEDTDGDDLGGHPQKVVDLLEADESFIHGSLKVGASKAAVLMLEGNTGEAELYRLADGTLVFAEPPRAWWDDEDNYGSRPSDVASLFEEALQGTKPSAAAGKVQASSGALLVFDSNADIGKAGKAREKLTGEGDLKKVGRDGAALVLALAPGTYAVRRRVLERKWAKGSPLVVAYLIPVGG